MHGGYEGELDVDAFRSRVLAPFRAGAPVPGTGLAAGDRGVLVVFGEYLLRPDLVGIWHSTVWLNTPLAPEPTTTEAGGRTPFEAGKRYLRQVDPKRRAMTNIDATDPAHLHRTFADSC